MNEGDALDKFIGDLLKDKDLSGVSDETRAYLVDDLKTKLIDQINRSIISELPEAKNDEFNAILDKDGVTDEEIQKFIADSGVDVKTITARTMLVFRELYLETPQKRAERQETNSESN